VQAVRIFINNNMLMARQEQSLSEQVLLQDGGTLVVLPGVLLLPCGMVEESNILQARSPVLPLQEKTIFFS